MNQQFSIYLDLIRISAAFLVFCEHLPGFTGGVFWQLSGFGHEAVILFFVLSGYVISYVVDKKESTFIDYAASRFARIYSVAIPSLLLTIILYYVGSYFNAQAFVKVSEKLNDPFLTIVSALLFINQSWWQLPVFSNFPYWSLGFEVLYYVFFGVLCFLKGKKRVILLCIISLIMGPRVFLYLPVWLLGVFCYRMSSRINWPFRISCLLFYFSLILMGVFSLPHVQSVVNGNIYNYIEWIRDSRFTRSADQLGSDYMLALAISLNILSFHSISRNITIFKSNFISGVRFVSSYTFSIYLYHLPILFFISSVVPHDKFPMINIFLCTVVTFIVILILGGVTEKKKYVYKRIFYSLCKYYGVCS